MLKDLLLRNRSYRRFEQEVRISEEELTELVGLTCLCASARNAQALKYVIVQTIRPHWEIASRFCTLQIL